MLTIWESHLSVLSLPQDLYEESELTLQLLLDEIIQQQIKNKADSLTVRVDALTISSLTVREENAIHYYGRVCCGKAPS